MLQKIIGRAKTSALMKKLRGGPQALLPMSPVKGSGVKSMKGLTPKTMRKYAAKKQNPANSPKTGGLTRLSRRR